MLTWEKFDGISPMPVYYAKMTKRECSLRIRLYDGKALLEQLSRTGYWFAVIASQPLKNDNKAPDTPEIEALYFSLVEKLKKIAEYVDVALPEPDRDIKMPTLSASTTLSAFTFDSDLPATSTPVDCSAPVVCEKQDSE